MFAWQATVQNEAGNIVPLPLVTVYQPDGSTLAEIYDETGAELENPFFGTMEGFAQFWVPGGKYKVQAALDSDATEVWDVVLGGTEYATRDNFVMAVAQGLSLSNGIVISAGGLQYVASSGATRIPDLPGWLPAGTPRPGHYSSNQDTAMTVANAAVGDIKLVSPLTVTAPVNLTRVSVEAAPYLTWAAMTSNGDLTWSYEMWRDSGFVPLHRYAGRTFFGAGARHSGNRNGPVTGYGGDPVSNEIATWVSKNSQVMGISPSINGRFGITGASWVQPGAGGNSASGVCGIGRNDGISGSQRGGYFEVIAAKTAGLGAADIAAEFQVGNRTGVTPTISAYNMGNSIVNGMQIAAESQYNYTLGDADVVYPPTVFNPGAVIDISGGTDGNRYVGGIVFRNGALVRDSNDYARAVIMAQKHKLQWEASAYSEGAAIWSEVSLESARMGQAFKNNEITMTGPSGQVLFSVLHDATGDGSRNWIGMRASRVGVYPKVQVYGEDENIGIEFIAKGIAPHRFMNAGGTGENFRIIPPNTGAANDFIYVTGSAGGGLATIGASGASANIDILMTPKGTGNLRFGSYTANADAPITGYITVKDSLGNLRKLAVIA